ncbi:transmembrane protein 41B isoform X2 [Nerophis lumbriciformis]|uniref:transmembrane protein 41B isoform X2 n=1 Tax=Nerophis lumbriciformis TaxID=546530 RepID=UPI002AE08D04|nr:transmembrane protein 41B-like isoform X2 [Nerophis lumbriciformis]
MATKRGDKRNIDGLAVSKEELVANAKDSTALNDSCHAAGGSARMSLLILLAIFTCSASVMYLVYRNFPELPDLQTFAIPGSIFLSILSGYLYPFPLALFLVCLCSGLGASFCYMLSYLVGRPMVYKYLTEKAQKWSQQVDKHRDHLINYIIFLRITPFLPNWFINITSPVINVPLGVFFIGTFLGVAPPSFVAINAGTTLYKLTTAGEAVSWNSLAVLGVLAVLSILPVCFQKKLQRKLE